MILLMVLKLYKKLKFLSFGKMIFVSLKVFV